MNSQPKNSKSIKYITVLVTFERRTDGGVRAYSDDVPGFVLSSLDVDGLIADVIPALEALFEKNFNMKVSFGLAEGLRASLEADGFLLPQGKTMREYVAPVPLAA